MKKLSEYKSKVIKYGNSQAISLNQKAMEAAGLNIGDRLEIVSVKHHKIIFKKVEEPTFKEKIQAFYKNGGKYTE